MADQTSIQEVLNTSLECANCFVRYDVQEKQTLILTCGHTFCKCCLEIQVDRYDIYCPNCRRYSKMSDVLGGQVCADCTKEKCSKMCLHCDLQICTSCHKQHMKQFKTDTKKTLENLQQDVESTKSLIKYCSSKKDIARAATETRQDVQAHLNHIKTILAEFQSEMEQEIRQQEENNLQKFKIWKEKVEEDMLSAESYYLPSIDDFRARDFGFNFPDEKQLQTSSFCNKIHTYVKAVILFLCSNKRHTYPYQMGRIDEKEMADTRKTCAEHSKKLNDAASSMSTILFSKYAFEHDETIKSLLPKHLGKMKTD